MVLQHEADELLAQRGLVDFVPPFAEGRGEVGGVHCVGVLARVPRVDVNDLLGGIGRGAKRRVQLREVGVERIDRQRSRP